MADVIDDLIYFFFFQAEDGIRDLTVTGVQTCALPIFRHAFGRFGKEVARGLAIRCDWGPQYIADAWINEVKWLGCTISPSYVGEPECNGVAERFMRTLKEQCIYLHQFESLEEARGIIGEFIGQYNTEWLIERLGHRTPAQARAAALGRAA